MALHTIILAAGSGTRMKSETPKVLHPVGGLPMLGHVLRASEALSPTRTTVVTSPQTPLVTEFIHRWAPQAQCVVQSTPQGTAHAVACALGMDLSTPSVGASPSAPEDEVTLILFGDTPLIHTSDLEALLSTPDPLALLAMTSDPPHAYGRVILDSDGKVEAIVEAAEATPDQRAVRLCNGGMMKVNSRLLVEALSQVTPSPRTKEWYLTHIVAIARAQGASCGYRTAPTEHLLGVNSRAELAIAESFLQERLRRAAMDGGATLMDPNSVYLSYDTQIGRDVVVFPHVYMGPGVVLHDRVTVRPFTTLNDCVLHEDVVVGPCAHIRPGTVIGAGARVGNFVEIKKSTLGAGSRIDHLSYVGDASVGDHARLGAGTITCNYNGVQKSATHIGAGAFVGSHSTLIAPVSIGEAAFVAAGSVITKDINAHDLAVARIPQSNRAGGGKALMQRLRQKTASDSSSPQEALSPSSQRT